MLNFVEKGGNIIFIADHYNADRNLNRFDSSEVMNGYRRGAYQDITKDLTNEEKHSKAMRNVKVQIGFLNTSAYVSVTTL